MSQVYDFTLHSLDKILQAALRDHDWARARTLSTVMGMYTKGILDVEWKCGEPIFHLTAKGDIIADDISSSLEKMIEEN